MRDWALRPGVGSGDLLQLRDGSNAHMLDSRWPACCGGEPMRRRGRKVSGTLSASQYQCDTCGAFETVAHGRMWLRVAQVDNEVRALLANLAPLPRR